MSITSGLQRALSLEANLSVFDEYPFPRDTDLIKKRQIIEAEHNQV